MKKSILLSALALALLIWWTIYPPFKSRSQPSATSGSEIQKLKTKDQQLDSEIEKLEKEKTTIKPIVKYRTVTKKVYQKPTEETIYYRTENAVLERKVTRDGGLLVIDLDELNNWVAQETEDEPDRVEIVVDTIAPIPFKPSIPETKKSFFQRLFKKKNKK